MSASFEGAEDPAVWEGIRDVYTRSFGMVPVQGEPWRDWENFAGAVGRGAFRALHENGQVAAALCTYRVGQWFGGVALPMGGLAAVAVAPEHRGTGAGRHLVAEQLRELHQEGVPPAALYASAHSAPRRG